MTLGKFRRGWSYPTEKVILVCIFSEFLSTSTISKRSVNPFWGYCWLKNSVIRLSKSKSKSRLQPATLLKLTFLHGCFSRFLNCTNSTKSRKASHIANKETVSRSSSRFRESSLEWVVKFLTCSEKNKVSRNNDSLWVVVTHCLSFSLVVPLFVTRCHSMYHSSVVLNDLWGRYN